MRNNISNKICDTKKCNAYCCRYISIHVGVPTRKIDFQVIKWYVVHKGISVYKDETGQWIIHVEKDCKFLKNNRCTDYENRPYECSEYDPKECSLSLHGIGAQLVFESPEDVDKYVARRWSKKKS